MRRARNVGILLLVLILCSCATLQEKWNKLTPDEQGRVVLNGLQQQLNSAFDQAKVVLITNPKWKTQVVPAFDVANQAIKTGIMAHYKPDQVFQTVQPLVNKVILMLHGMGVKI